MSDSLRDQLLGLGFKPAPKPERKPDGGKPHAGKPGAQPGNKPHGGRPDARGQDNRRPARQDARPAGGARPPSGGARPAQPAAQRPAQPPRPGQGKPGAGGRGRPQTREDIDLAKAYAIRAQREKDERIAAEQAKQEEARKRREARAQLAELVKGHGLNSPDADIARHFPYGGKIKRVYVTEPQLKALNAGELGVLQLEGRYLLVTAELLAQAEAVFAPAVALKVDPNAPMADDPYADPKFQVPDDLVW